MQHTAPLGGDTQMLQQQIAELQSQVARLHDEAAAARAAEAQFREFLDHSAAVAFIKDDQGRRTYVNRSYYEANNLVDSVIGKSDREVFDEDVANRVRRRDLHALSTGKSLKLIEDHPGPGGETRHWLSDCFPIEEANGRRLVGCVSLDITEFKQAQDQLRQLNEELEARVQQRTAELSQANRELEAQLEQYQRVAAALRKSETRYRKLMEQSVLATQIFSPQGTTLAVNRAWEQLWGLTIDDVRDYNLLADEQLNQLGLMHSVQRALVGEASPVEEVCYVGEVGNFAGQEHWTRAVVYPVKDEQTGVVEEIVILHHDITPEKISLRQLRAEQALLRKLFDLQESERRLLAYEIHDGLVQDMVGAHLMVAAATHQLEPGPSQAGPSQTNTVELLHKADQIGQRAIAEARRLISELRPMILDEGGVADAIRYLIEEHRSAGSTAIEFDHQIPCDRLPPLLENSLFRIAQESLNNALRYSGATRVQIRLTHDGPTLELTIDDNGRGFDPKQVPDDRFGLEGIRKRAEIFGGRADIVSRTGQGTSVRVEIPVPEKP